MIIAQITDTHIKPPGLFAYRVVDTATCLRAAVSALARLVPVPAAVVVTGDLVDRGLPEEYAHLRALLGSLRMPVYLIPGNHDDRDALRAAFKEDGYFPADGFLHYAVDVGPLRLVALDTLVPGEGGGNLCEARLEWLAATLAEAPARPTVILMHHPPFETGIAHMDRLGSSQRRALRGRRGGAQADRAHPLRTPAPLDPGPGRRHHREHGPEHRPPGDPGPPPRGPVHLHHGAARIPAPPVATRPGHHQPHGRDRRLRRPYPFFKDGQLIA